MGSGASVEENNADDDKPIRLRPVANNLTDTYNVENLEAQGAAQWRRIIQHAKEQTSLGNTNDDGHDEMNRIPKNYTGKPPISAADTEIAQLLLHNAARRPTTRGALTQMCLDMAKDEQEQLQAKQKKSKHSNGSNNNNSNNNSNYTNTLLQDDMYTFNISNSKSIPNNNRGDTTSTLKKSMLAADASTTTAGKSNPSMYTMNSFLSNLVPVTIRDKWNQHKDDPDMGEDDPNKPRKWEDEEFRPEIILPVVKLQLKSRTSTSVSLIYDIDMESWTLLQSIRRPDDLTKIMDPQYQFEYRVSLHKSDKTPSTNNTGLGDGNGVVGSRVGVQDGIEDNEAREDELSVHMNKWR